jgi:hypothetical protein
VIQKIKPLQYELATGQEHFFAGGTPPPKSLKDLYKPLAVLDGLHPGLVNENRKESMYFLGSSMLTLQLGLEGNIVVTYSPLDESGRVISDPEILGTWDAEKGEIIRHPDRDLTRELVDKFREYGTELPMRFMDAEGRPSGETKG